MAKVLSDYKISPFTPLFFHPSSDKFGADSKYIQLFAPGDNILIEILSEVPNSISGYIIDKVTEKTSPLEFQSFLMSNDIHVSYINITGLPNGYYSVVINDEESDIFKVTDDEQELAETTLIRYSMHNNKLRRDCVFWNGDTQLIFEFRAPGGFKDDDWTFAVDNEQFELDDGNIVELFAIESTQKKFTLGNAKGCPVWYADHLNRILCCSNVYFNGKRFVRKGNSTPEMTQEIVSLKSYIFKVTLQGMVDNIDIDFPDDGDSGGGSESEGGGSGYIYLIKLNDKVVPTDKNTFSSLRMLAEINKAIQKNNESLSDKFISKEYDDKVSGIITFLKLIKSLGGIDIGKAIDSLTAGTGILLRPDGRIQAGSLELRSSLTVLELIFNRLSAQEGDATYSESGVIERVELLEDGTYRLPLRKRHDKDFTAFDWNDIVFGSVNDLATGGGNYRTSWLRVLGVNIAENYIEAVLYPDEEVPGGKNYPPEPLMMLTRRGNATDENRQSYWYISSYEKCICMLDGVTKPILEENNYSVIIGRMKNLSLFDHLPINYRQSYVYCRGLIRQDDIRVTVTGKPIYELVDRGIWSLSVATSSEPYYFETKNTTTGRNETSTAYHRGAKWQCLKTATHLEPKWNSTDWAFLEGNGEFSIDFESSKGNAFFYGRIDTVVEAKFYHGTTDITEDVMSTPGTLITWSRKTGKESEDRSWSPTFVDNQKNKIHLIESDMGSEWLKSQSVIFKLDAIIPLGEENYLRESEELQFNL